MQGLPDYYIQELEISQNTEPPSSGEEVSSEGSLVVEFNQQDPEVHESEQGEAYFECRFELEMELWNSDNQDDIESEDADSLGQIDVSLIVRQGGELERLEEELERWESGEYTDMSDEFIGILESNLLYNVLVPIQQLMENTFEGLVPKTRFTPPTEE